MTTTTNLDLETIAERIIEIFPRLDADEQEVSLAIYRRLARGRPVALGEVAAAAGLPEARVSRILDRWPGVYRDGDGAIIGYWGLALPEMGHEILVDGQQLYAWCAWDTLFLPQLLGKTAEVRSRCPATGEGLRLTVTPEGVQRIAPGGVHLSFVAPDPEGVQADIISSFCHHIFFFASAEAGARWVKEKDGTFLISLDDGLYLARRKNAAQYRRLISSRETDND